MKRIVLLIFLCCGLLLISCTSKTVKTEGDMQTMEEAEEIVLPPDAGKILTVQVKSENVRREPNGKKLGQLRNGDEIKVIKRLGNWIQFSNEKYKGAYIWAPSVGYAYENLYSPFFYYDSTQKLFREMSYFQSIFSQKGQRREETTSNYELFFKNLGLGSHESVVLNVVTESKQVVEHGVTFFVNKSDEKVTKVKVDYFKAVEGYENALKKSELPVVEPPEENSGHLIWMAGQLLPGLTVDLERKEWDSKLFSSIWYILPEKVAKK